MTCEDWPCCGHEYGCCPDYDLDGGQLDMKCICGASVPFGSPSSLCTHCLNAPDSEDFEYSDGYEDRGDEDYDDGYDPEDISYDGYGDHCDGDYGDDIEYED